MRPVSSYLVCATARSGSTLLCDALIASGVAGIPEEYLMPGAQAALTDGVWATWDRSDVKGYIEATLERGTTDNGVFGAKVSLRDLRALEADLRRETNDYESSGTELLSRVFPDLKFIWMTRRDKVRQAISLVKARQTGQYVDKGTGRPAIRDEPVFTLAHIEQMIRNVVRSEAEWSEFFTENQIKPLTVVYEDLVAARDETLSDVFRFLGLDSCVQQWPAPRIRRQADASSEEWVRRYRARTRLVSRALTVMALPVTLRHAPLRRAFGREFLSRRVLEGKSALNWARSRLPSGG